MYGINKVTDMDANTRQIISTGIAAFLGAVLGAMMTDARRISPSHSFKRFFFFMLSILLRTISLTEILDTLIIGTIELAADNTTASINAASI
ncbi:MAG: hypothetical protein BWY61_02107 [Firmicutes bacterium ADurb.Bin354]|nr:MAG: hypothetical protein BWY61_02107 [Firmicutes bacterium ADurb.Bin354]